MLPKVLLLQNTISNYRIPIFNIIAKDVDLTVGYTLKSECTQDCKFNVIQLDYKNVLGLFIVTNGFKKTCSEYDVVIFVADLHSISYCYLPFMRRKFKVIPWTIGVRASYTRSYDTSRKMDIIDKIYAIVLQKSDAIIFYLKESIYFWKNSIDINKIFIAHNTVKVLDNRSDIKHDRNRILFIGSLYKEKRIYELIDAFVKAKERSNSHGDLFLDIVGDGEEFQKIKSLIMNKGLTNYIFLHGSIFDENELKTIFSKTLLCISPSQAGLSVLKSMGYGVPFVTRSDALTGGERLNIINKENGLLYNKEEELVEIIESAYTNPEMYSMMGDRAQKYYYEYATINNMAKGVTEAINYSLR